MNKATGLMGIAALLAALTGCSTYHRVESHFTQPLVREVKKGMTQQQVQAIAGAPAKEMSMVHAKGRCQTYIFNQHHGKPLTYFVSYDPSGRVMNYGFQRCQDYDSVPPS